MNRYEKNYLRWYFVANKKKLLFLIVLLLVSLPLYSLLTPEVTTERVYSVPFVTKTCIYLFFMFVLTLLVPLYNFHFLMGKRSIDTYFALPIKRKRFFLLQYLLGIGCVLMLVNGAFLFALVCEPQTWELATAFLTFMAFISIAALCLYTMYTFLIMKCNNLWDAIAVCIAYTILPIIMFSALNALVEDALASFLVSSIANVQEVFAYTIWQSFLSLLALGMYITTSFFETIFTMHFESLYFFDGFFTFNIVAPLCFWLIVSAILFIRGARAFALRDGEASEQRTTAKVCYPVLIVFITASLLMNDGISFAFLDSIMSIAFIFVLYLLMVFFAKRKIALTKSVLFIFAGLVACVMSITFVFTSTRGFHMIQELPDLDQVDKVSVYYYSDVDPFELEGKAYTHLNSIPVKNSTTVEDIYNLQDFIANNIDKQEITYELRLTMGMQYNLKNGNTIQREYRFLDNEEDVKSAILSVMEDLYEKGYFYEDIKQQVVFE